MKREFLVAYDYGQGAVWAYLAADSEMEIAQRFPELTVVHDRPSWLTADDENRLRRNMSLDIDDKTHRFMIALLKQRRTGTGAPEAR
jgi:hypothetical protein